MHRIRTLSSVVVLALLLAACGGNGGNGTADDGGAQASTATFVAVDIAYDEAPSEVPAGEVTFELVNQGEIEHNITIEELGEDPVVETTSGETATGSVTLEAGTYTYYCSVPGHRDAGMEGTLTVSG